MNDVEKLALSAVAVGLAAFGGPIWSKIKAALERVPPDPAVVPAPVAKPDAPATLDAATFAGSIEALAIVRRRLAKTECLDEPSAAAIETLTHSLVKGSDK